MSDTLARLESFIADWREPLSGCAEIVFHAVPRASFSGAAPQIADSLVSAQGYKTIGFDWELLDTAAGPAASRSALGAFEDALAKDLAMKDEWLGTERALRCGRDFIAAFAPHAATILTNHIVRDGGKSEGWNPISGATYEWAFVGFDDSAAALLLLTAEG
jgi:hypothetical protein